MQLAALHGKNYYKWLVLINVSIGTFMATMDSSSVSVALPTIAGSFHIPLTTVQWVVTAYLLTISSLLLAFGRFADLIGKSRVFSTGFLGFALGSALCSLSGSISQLVTFRVIEGIGAAMLMATSMGITTGVFPPQERGRALGIVGTVVAVGSMTGPSLGGFLVGAFGWRSIFYMNIFLGIIAFVASWFVLPKDPPRDREQSFDFLGAALFAGFMAVLLMGLNAGRAKGWVSMHAQAGLAAAAVLLILFLIVEKKVRHPLLDLSLFRNRQFSAGSLAALLSFVAMFFTTVLMPFYMEEVVGYPTEKVGLMMMAFPAVMAVVAPVSGFLSDRIGPNVLTTGGMAINSLSLYALSHLNVSTPAWVIALLLGLMGLGMGLFMSPNNSSIMGTVPPPKLGITGGIVATVRNVGMVIGIALSVSLFAGRQQHLLAAYTNPGVTEKKLAFVGSLSFVFLVASVICVAGLAASAVRGKNTNN